VLPCRISGAFSFFYDLKILTGRKPALSLPSQFEKREIKSSLEAGLANYFKNDFAE
jgi:hypothetical protein